MTANRPMDTAAARPLLADLLRKPVRALERIGNGGNSKVYRVDCDDGSRYAAKFYFARTADQPDRLDTEFPGLRMLWEAGERCVPQAVIADRENRVAVYQYIDGAQIDPRTVTPEDIEQFVMFAGRLKALAPARLDQCPNAAEACFSFPALYESIRRRLERLLAVNSEGDNHAALRQHLTYEFAPALETITTRIKCRIGDAAWAAELPRSAWTLSPSDFGFHNALRRGDGTIVFLDFEHFGRDDPAKLICDFLLHPAMQLGDGMKHAFTAGMLECFGGDPGLPERVALGYPLYGLKWCTILLNEFVLDYLERREFAGSPRADREQVRARLLVKSRSMLGRIRHESEHLPTLEKRHG